MIFLTCFFLITFWWMSFKIFSEQLSPPRISLTKIEFLVLLLRNQTRDISNWELSHRLVKEKPKLRKLPFFTAQAAARKIFIFKWSNTVFPNIMQIVSITQPQWKFVIIVFLNSVYKHFSLSTLKCFVFDCSLTDVFLYNRKCRNWQVFFVKTHHCSVASREDGGYSQYGGSCMSRCWHNSACFCRLVYFYIYSIPNKTRHFMVSNKRDEQSFL